MLRLFNPGINRKVKIIICYFMRSHELVLFLGKPKPGEVTVCPFLESCCYSEFARFVTWLYRDQNLWSPTESGHLLYNQPETLQRSSGWMNELLSIKDWLLQFSPSVIPCWFVLSWPRILFQKEIYQVRKMVKLLFYWNIYIQDVDFLGCKIVHLTLSEPSAFRSLSVTIEDLVRLCKNL